MTKQSPRINTYKITFEEVPYYYYGVHKEKRFNEEYWGSPHTNKWAWEFYTPKKQILEFFEYSDEGWLEAQKIEERLIKPFYNTDKWCLNACCGLKFSLELLRKNGRKLYERGEGMHSISKEERREIARKVGQKAYELGIGIHSMTKEERQEIGRRNGKRCYELGIGVCGRSKEEMIEQGRKTGKRMYEEGRGVFSRTKEEMIEQGRRAGQKLYEEGRGIHGRSPEQKREDAIKGGKVAGKITSSQQWMCTVTGHISNAGGLYTYQRNRNIDTNNRIRIK